MKLFVKKKDINKEGMDGWKEGWMGKGREVKEMEEKYLFIHP